MLQRTSVIDLQDMPMKFTTMFQGMHILHRIPFLEIGNRPIVNMRHLDRKKLPYISSSTF